MKRETAFVFPAWAGIQSIERQRNEGLGSGIRRNEDV
jgi:hypothetical protein